MPVALIARHDERRARSDRAKAANYKLVHAFILKKEPRTIVKAVAVVIAGIVTVTTDDDVGVCDLLVERDALERAFKEVVHRNTPCIGSILACVISSMQVRHSQGVC